MKQHEAFQAALPEGWRVRFQHERPRVMVYDPPSPFVAATAIGTHSALALATRWVLSSHKGGHTVCEIMDAQGRVMSAGYAYCSDRDNYCKRTGRELAFERAAFGSPAVTRFQRVRLAILMARSRAAKAAAS